MSLVPVNPPLPPRAPCKVAPRPDAEVVERFEENGIARVRVPLSGKHGIGFSMTLDATDWDDIRARGWPFFSIVTPCKDARRAGYVSTASRPISTDGNAVSLARFIMKPAGAHEHVGYIDGDEFNLTRENLCVHKASEWSQWGYTRAAMQRAKGEELGVPWD